MYKACDVILIICIGGGQIEKKYLKRERNEKKKRNFDQNI